MRIFFRVIGSGKPVVPSGAGGYRKPERQQHEHDLHAHVRQLENEEQRVADFQHQPAHDQIGCGHLQNAALLEFRKERVHVCFLIARRGGIFAHNAQTAKRTSGEIGAASPARHGAVY
jgi:hypothetical protein